jgi:DNA invertase Pin-like site-specific DNA recombinase
LFNPSRRKTRLTVAGETPVSAAICLPVQNKLTIHILAAVAEHEREAISERTKAALAAAKARGMRLGTPGSGRRRGAHACCP